MHVLVLENGQQTTQRTRWKRACFRCSFTLHVHLRDRGNPMQVFSFGLGTKPSDEDSSAGPKFYLRACALHDPRADGPFRFPGPQNERGWGACTRACSKAWVDLRGRIPPPTLRPVRIELTTSGWLIAEAPQVVSPRASGARWKTSSFISEWNHRDRPGDRFHSIGLVLL